MTEALVRQPMIVDSSRYWEVFDAYRRRFDESRIAIVWFEEYIAEPTTAFQSICRFLDIDDTVKVDPSVAHMNSRAEAATRLAAIGRGHLRLNTTWHPSVRRTIVRQIREDNERFLCHFARPLDYWRNLY